MTAEASSGDVIADATGGTTGEITEEIEDRPNNVRILYFSRLYRMLTESTLFVLPAVQALNAVAVLDDAPASTISATGLVKEDAGTESDCTLGDQESAEEPQEVTAAVVDKTASKRLVNIRWLRSTLRIGFAWVRVHGCGLLVKC